MMRCAVKQTGTNGSNAEPLIQFGRKQPSEAAPALEHAVGEATT
jgi:hypothetical protein